MQEQITRIAQMAAEIRGMSEATDELAAQTEAAVKTIAAYLKRKSLPEELEWAAAEYIADGDAVAAITEGNVSLTYAGDSGLRLRDLPSGGREGRGWNILGERESDIQRRAVQSVQIFAENEQHSERREKPA